MATDSFIENKQNEQKTQKVILYNQAYLTSLFIGKMLGGKTIPQIGELFPELNQTPQDVKEEEKVDNSWMIIKERMIDFANEANKRRNK